MIQNPGNNMQNVASMSESLTTLNAIMGTFQTQSSQFTASSSSTIDVEAQIEELRQRIEYQRANQHAILSDVKKRLPEDIKDQVSLSLKSQIGDILNSEVQRLAKLEIDEQMRDYSLDRLHAEIEDSKKRVSEARVSLANSQARLQNSNIRSEYVDDNLAVVVTPEGRRSDMYPRSLGALLEYDSDEIRALIRDFGLVEAETDETNLNQFLAHIGTRAKVAGRV